MQNKGVTDRVLSNNPCLVVSVVRLSFKFLFFFYFLSKNHITLVDTSLERISYAVSTKKRCIAKTFIQEMMSSQKCRT